MVIDSLIETSKGRSQDPQMIVQSELHTDLLQLQMALGDAKNKGNRKLTESGGTPGGGFSEVISYDGGAFVVG